MKSCLGWRRSTRTWINSLMACVARACCAHVSRSTDLLQRKKTQLCCVMTVHRVAKHSRCNWMFVSSMNWWFVYPWARCLAVLRFIELRSSTVKKTHAPRMDAQRVQWSNRLWNSCCSVWVFPAVLDYGIWFSNFVYCSWTAIKTWYWMRKGLTLEHQKEKKPRAEGSSMKKKLEHSVSSFLFFMLLRSAPVRVTASVNTSTSDLLLCLWMLNW